MLSVNYLGEVLANPSLMHEPMYYSILWVFIGILFLGIICSIIAFILYVTRKKSLKTLANLKPKAPKFIDITALRKKYLALVDETEQRFGMRKIRAASAHQEFSLIVRLFYAEACGFHAEVLTLKDLKHSKNSKLATLIEEYYPEEFNGLNKGSVLDSGRKARELIMDNEALPRMQHLQSSAIQLPRKGGRK